MPPLLIDTHCHLNFDSYEPDRADVIARAASAGVTRIIIPAVDLATTRESLALAEQYPGKIFATSGVHPNSTTDFDDLYATVHRVKRAEAFLDAYPDLLALSGGSSTGGYGPAFVANWLRTRLKAGKIIERGGRFVMEEAFRLGVMKRLGRC